MLNSVNQKQLNQWLLTGQHHHTLVKTNRSLHIPSSFSFLHKARVWVWQFHPCESSYQFLFLWHMISQTLLDSEHETTTVTRKVALRYEEGKWNASVGKGGCYQAWQPVFSPWDLHDRQKNRKSPFCKRMLFLRLILCFYFILFSILAAVPPPSS